MKQNIKTIIITIVAILALILPVFTKLPYNYFVILRWFICILALYYVYLFYTIRKFGLLWLMAIIAILFNPIAKFYFRKETWLIIDLVVAAVFGFNLFYLNKIRK
ncbi:MAG: DUF6804 family protein [Candidatus Margulisiibacteriota bacterium]|nr:DUF6804 family protein [Candidatus Margulisiibacteriota bacterium]